MLELKELVNAVPVEDASKRRKGDTKDHSLSQWFTNFSEADELLQLAAARQQVCMTILLSYLKYVVFMDVKSFLWMSNRF